METSQGDMTDVVSRLRRYGTDLTRIEVKAAVGGVGRSAWDSVSAFANTNGGLLVLGLDESDGFRAAAGFEPLRVRDAAVAGLAEAVHPRPVAHVDLADVDGATVVIVDVEELAPHDKPCFVVTKGKEAGSFERRADGDHRMSTYQVFLHSINVSQPQDDIAVVEEARLDDLDADIVARMLRRLRTAGRRAVADVTSDVDALRRLNVLARNRDDAVPTVAGLLALGRYPQEFLPQWMISLAVYPGPTKDAVEDDIRMLDHVTIDGPIPHMVDRAVEAVVRNLRSELRSRGAGAEARPEIPVDVIREAVVNAVTHRDYSQFVRGEQVRIEIFPDRVEVLNAGGIWGGRSERDLLDGVSRSRNERLALLLQDVPFGDRNEVVCENKGSGIPRMAGLMRRRGLAIPRFTDRTTSFRVTLDRHGLLDPPTRLWLADSSADGLTGQAQCALALARRGDQVDDQTLRHQLGIDSRDAQLLLAGLVGEGWLSRPRRRGRSFVLGERMREIDAPALLPRPQPVESGADSAILAVLDVVVPRTVHDVVADTGIAISSVRRRLNALVDHGRVLPTAPPTSRRRAYLRVDDG